jgi:hypothetical protein
VLSTLPLALTMLHGRTSTAGFFFFPSTIYNVVLNRSPRQTYKQVWLQVYKVPVQDLGETATPLKAAQTDQKKDMGALWHLPAPQKANHQSPTS